MEKKHVRVEMSIDGSGKIGGRDADEMFPNRTMASTAALAYTLGLRHALDADHISVRPPIFDTLCISEF